MENKQCAANFLIFLVHHLALRQYNTNAHPGSGVDKQGYHGLGGRGVVGVTQWGVKWGGGEIRSRWGPLVAATGS